MVLSKLEIYFYFLLYAIFIIYGVINVCRLTENVAGNTDFDKSKSWSLIGRLKDDSNYEWEIFKDTIQKSYSWYILHLGASEFIRVYCIKFLSATHFIIGFSFICATFNIKNTFIILIQILCFYYVSKFNNKVFIWLAGFIWVTVINLLKTNSYFNNIDSYDEYYNFLVSLSWNLLKCLSYCLSKSHPILKENEFYSFINYLGYAYYMPTFLYAPIIIYDRYKVCLRNEKKNKLNNNLRYRNFIIHIVKIVLYYFFIEFALHFMYIHYLESNFEFITSLNSLALFGYGYIIGQFFHLNYIVYYGLGIAIANFDNIHAPKPPKCIARINFYSDMWKYFDQGLYEFLLKYIYVFLCRKESHIFRKLAASILTFAFIYVWHGFFTHVLIWSTLNLVCLYLEKLFKILVKSEPYVCLTNKYLTDNGKQRLWGILGTQIFIPSVISNFYFFAGTDVGNYFMEKTYFSNWLDYFYISCTGYCIYQCSAVIWHKEKSFKKT